MSITDWLIHISLFISLYFEVFLLLSFWEESYKTKKNKIKKINYKITKYPSTTIVVPCWNEQDTLAGTINSLLQLNYPKDKLKIVIVDDGSTDNTWKVAQTFEKYPNIKLIQKENGGKHTAMNLALKNTNTELVGCLDADSFVDPDALKYLIPHFQKNKNIVSVTPAIKISNPYKILGKIQKSEYLTSIFIRKVFAILDSVFITPGPFSFFRTAEVKKVGGWKKAYNT